MYLEKLSINVRRYLFFLGVSRFGPVMSMAVI
jgi:hypothetical protein